MTTSVEIRGINVQFPFSPYELQKDYMSKVIETLQEGSQALLESPTGTGKTLSLLCATLAWLEDLYQGPERFRRGEQLSPAGQNKNLDLTTYTHNANGQRPKIVYASRTHSQLAQVVKELKSTKYRVRMTILGSREQMCVHPQISQLKSTAQDYQCRAAVANHTCKFSENLVRFADRYSMLSEETMDIEDLVEMGRDQRICPYHYSRKNSAEAELVFMPYNYLVDPKLRRTLNLTLQGAILIFDEAHNLESVCADSASFDLSAVDMAGAIGEVQRCIDIANNPQQQQEVIQLGLDASVLLQLKGMFLNFEQVIFKQPLGAAGKGFTQPGHYVFTLFEEINLKHETKDKFLEVMEQVINLYFNESGAKNRNQCAMQKIVDVVRVVFKGHSKQEALQMSQNYRVHIHAPEGGSVKGGKVQREFFADNRTSPGQQNRTLSYWCFNPGVAFSTLKEFNLRSVILTSGTLSPLDSFAYELMMPFPIRLENPHVITSDQAWVGVVSKGPSGVKLNSSYTNRSNPAYLNDLGNALVNFARIVPDGLLVFFPSYTALEESTRAWETGTESVMSRIKKYKQVVVEPRSSAALPGVILDYQMKLRDPNSKGAIFMAVCRGKVSEGLDFADKTGRAVMVTGIPYPMALDARVKLKQEFLDSAPKVPGIVQLTGKEWYNQQASRSINQSVGRVIRHCKDFGAILLCDERFENPHVQSQLSKWIRPRIQSSMRDFGQVAKSLMDFFRNCKATGMDAAEWTSLDDERQKAQREKEERQARQRRMFKNVSNAAQSISAASDESIETLRKAVLEEEMGKAVPPPLGPQVSLADLLAGKSHHNGDPKDNDPKDNEPKLSLSQRLQLQREREALVSTTVTPTSIASSLKTNFLGSFQSNSKGINSITNPNKTPSNLGRKTDNPDISPNSRPSPKESKNEIGASAASSKNAATADSKATAVKRFLAMIDPPLSPDNHRRLLELLGLLGQLRTKESELKKKKDLQRGSEQLSKESAALRVKSEEVLGQALAFFSDERSYLAGPFAEVLPLAYRSVYQAMLVSREAPDSKRRKLLPSPGTPETDGGEGGFVKIHSRTARKTNTSNPTTADKGQDQVRDNSQSRNQAKKDSGALFRAKIKTALSPIDYTEFKSIVSQLSALQNPQHEGNGKREVKVEEEIKVELLDRLAGLLVNSSRSSTLPSSSPSHDTSLSAECERHLPDQLREQYRGLRAKHVQQVCATEFAKSPSLMSALACKENSGSEPNAPFAQLKDTVRSQLPTGRESVKSSAPNLETDQKHGRFAALPTGLKVGPDVTSNGIAGRSAAGNGGDGTKGGQSTRYTTGTINPTRKLTKYNFDLVTNSEVPMATKHDRVRPSPSRAPPSTARADHLSENPNVTTERPKDFQWADLLH